MTSKIDMVDSFRNPPPIRPQRSGSYTVTIPTTPPPFDSEGFWSPKEWSIENTSSTGIELWAAGDFISDFSPRPIGTYVGSFFIIQANCDTESYRLLVDDHPGFRVSLPYGLIQIKPVLYMSSRWASIANVAGLKYRWQWAASTGNGSRGFAPMTLSRLYEEPVLAGTTSNQIIAPAGARSVTVQAGIAIPANVQVRQFSRLDTLTGVATNLATEKDIILSSESYSIAIINGSASNLRVTPVWNIAF
jgi:hypothetical protein